MFAWSDVALFLGIGGLFMVFCLLLAVVFALVWVFGMPFKLSQMQGQIQSLQNKNANTRAQEVKDIKKKEWAAAMADLAPLIEQLTPEALKSPEFQAAAAKQVAQVAIAHPLVASDIFKKVQVMMKSDPPEGSSAE